MLSVKLLNDERHMLAGMKMIRFSFAGLALLATMMVVVALTTLPLSGRIIRVVKEITVIDGHPNANDALGHAALYGMLMAAGYVALRQILSYRWALGLTLAATLALGFATELFQQFSPGRTMDLSDLLANWLGAMTIAAVIGFTRR
jgi:VanZ family protein